jgi:lipopolysaccharide export system protein LptA
MMTSTWVQDLVNGGPSHRDVEIFGSVIQGYENNHVSWIIRAKSIWAEGNKTAFKLNALTNGQLFDDKGDVVVRNMSAETGEVNTRSKTIFLKHVAAELGYRSPTAKTGLMAAETKARSVKIQADELRYFGTSKRTFLTGRVTIYQGSHKIVPSNGMEVDNANNIAYIKDGFTIYVDQLVITGNTMTILIDQELSEVPDGISGYRPASPTSDPELDSRENALRKLTTRFSAKTMQFSSKNGEDIITLDGEVVIRQADKSVQADRLVYDRASDVLTFDTNVVLRSDQLRWALSDRKKAIKNDDMRKGINQPIKILGNKAIFEGGTKRGRVLGNVQVYQESQKTFSQKLEMDDTEGTLRFTGSVSYEKANNDTLKCDELTIDMNKEEMVAKRSITTEFKLRPKAK